ncbi:MAG: molecular chaperone TorD family protein [Acidobacteria bacterium]|nr:molecular chaperone TorD family protein [Acidobacteriota bacterium]
MSPEIVRLLTEAAEWRLYGLLFEYPGEAWREQVRALLPDLREDGLRQLGEAALQYATPGLHIALFGPAGSVPAREVKWQGGVQFGYLMAELNAYYEAFGYAASAEEVADHYAIELGFVAYLKMKQALALSEEAELRAEVVGEAQARFLKDHIAVCAEPISKLLESYAPEYLIEAGRRILALAGPSPRSAYPLALPDEIDDDSNEMMCGPAPEGEDLIHIQP